MRPPDFSNAAAWLIVACDVFAVHLQIERLAFEQGEDDVFFADGDFNQTASVVDMEGVACPCARLDRCKAAFAAPSFHLGVTLDDGEPRAGHRSNVQAVFGVVVVVVQVQACGAPVHFHGFFFFAQFGGENRVDTGRQRAFVHGHRFVEVEVAAFFVDIETFAEEVDALQYVRLFDKGRTQDFVPRPFPG